MDVPETSSEAKLSNTQIVEVSTFELDSRWVAIAQVPLVMWAETMRSRFWLDRHNSRRRYYRCICGEWQLDILTPKVERSEEP